MIRYDLECSSGHRFEAWFRNSTSCDEQLSSQIVSCACCGSSDVHKALMAPALSKSAPSGGTSNETATYAGPGIEHIFANAEDVGTRFAEEARDIEAGLADERDIRGIATAEEVRELAADGIEFFAAIPRREH